jgi:hypothetical protein
MIASWDIVGCIQGAVDRYGPVGLDMKVDYGGLDTAVAQELFDVINIHTLFEQVGGKTVAIMPSSA